MSVAPAACKLSDFADVQPQAVTHLTQALAGSRQAHAFLLVGAAASHAPQIARALVASLLCTARSGRDACGQCADCRNAATGQHANLHTLVAERPSGIAVGQVRALRGRLALVGREAKATVVHVPQASDLNAAAQQALLKTLEEPQGPTTFVMVSHHAAALLPTLRSRMSVLWLGRRDEAKAAATLRAGGVAPHLAAWAAPQVGDDVAAAEALVDAGLGQTLDRLHEALAGAHDVTLLARCAQELGQDQAHFAMTLTALAVHLRDALMGRLSAPEALQRSAKSRPLVGHVATNQLCAAVDALHNLLRANVANLNRPLALEGLFLLLNQSAAS